MPGLPHRTPPTRAHRKTYSCGLSLSQDHAAKLRLEKPGRTTQSALIGLISPCDEPDRLGDEVRTSATARAPSSQIPEVRLVRVVDHPVLLTQPMVGSAVALPNLLDRDASHQFLQSTCCHEHPNERAIPKLGALALSTAAAFHQPGTSGSSSSCALPAAAMPEDHCWSF